MRPIQKTMFPTVLFRLTAGSLPSAIMGSCAIYPVINDSRLNPDRGIYFLRQIIDSPA
jgi:hypothetical protein